MLRHSPEHLLAKDVLLEELAIQCPREDPGRLFHVLMNWGRFANLWTYDSATRTLGLPRAKGSRNNNLSNLEARI